MKLKRVLLTLLALALMLGALFVTASATDMENYAAIIAQPENVLVGSGEVASVTVEATGDGLTYKWYYKNQNASKYTLTTFTGNTYTTTMDSSKDGRQVYCVVKDQYGTTLTTDTVTLNMKRYAKITTQPKNALVGSGEVASVTVKATGDGLTYKWYYKNKSASKFTLTTFTGDTYTTTMGSSKDGRQVYCVVKDKYGTTVTTKTVTLSLKRYAKITTQPQNAATDSGKQAKVTVKATGDGLTYKWYYKNKGASKFTLTTFTGNAYTTTMDSSKNGRQVYCVVKDKYGTTVTTKTVTLSLKRYAAITTQPKDVAVDYGMQAKVTVKATGDGLTYKWYYKNQGASKFTLTSATSNTYTITMDGGKAGRQVYCKITDKYGKTVTTKTVTLTMKQEANIVSKGVWSDWGLRWTLDKDGVLYVYRMVGNSTANTKWNKNLVKKIWTKGNLDYISGWADNHPNLTYVYVSSSVRGVYSIFSGCPKLKSIVVSGSNTNYTSVDNVLYNKAKTALLTYPAGKTGTPTIPTSVETIAYKAFAGAKDLKTISIPKSVKSIGLNAFIDCSGLEKITLTTGLEEISNGAFENCTSLKTFNIPSTLTQFGWGGPDGIRDVFTGCSALESITVSSNSQDFSAENGILYNKGKDRLLFYPFAKTGTPTIPSSVTSIAYGAFAGSENLKSITIPKSVKSIERGAFKNCTNLAKITLSTGLKAIDEDVFINCSSLKTINIPSTVTQIGSEWQNAPGEAFVGCTALESITVSSSNQNYSAENGILYNKGKDRLLFYPFGKTGTPTIPSSVTSIAYGAFAGSENLKSITIPKSVKSIESDAFADCTNLAKITLSTGLKAIDEGVFRNCTSLKTINIPSTVTQIGSDWRNAPGEAFVGCTALESITVSSSNKNYSAANGILYNKDKTELLLYPMAKTGTPTIPSGVAVIGYRAFSGAKYLKSITIPKSVTEIGSFAFENCENLSTVKLSASLQFIEGGAFANCDSLKSITIPASVTSMSWDIFAGCDSLTQVTFNGDCPSGWGALDGIKATVYYPKGNSTWNPDTMNRISGYSDDITWKAK